MSANEAGFDLRENPPLPRNILHTCEVMAYGFTGQRTSLEIDIVPPGHRGWLRGGTSPKVSTDNLTYSVGVRDTAKSGMGHMDNRHLHYLVESIAVNVGGSGLEVSSQPMKSRSGGGVIVVRVRENRIHGEGHQFVGIPAQNNQMTTWRNLL